jgi:two-component system response regulator PrrA
MYNKYEDLEKRPQRLVPRKEGAALASENAATPTALVVEDNKNMAFAFSEALRTAGYAVEVVADGHMAMSKLALNAPDVVILDLHLQSVNGDVVLQSIRENRNLARTRVILTTADDRLAQELEDQADLVLLKPVGFVQLRDLARRLRPPKF